MWCSGRAVLVVAFEVCRRIGPGLGEWLAATLDPYHGTYWLDSGLDAGSALSVSACHQALWCR